MNEIWKDVVGYEGLYQVSNLGEVKSLNYNKTKKEKVLKKSKIRSGYLKIRLHKFGEYKDRSVHSLVAESFMNHKPLGFKIVVNHKNFIKTDNRLENLELVTNRENSNQKHLKSSSKYVGVYWHKFGNKWNSAIRINGKKKHLGSFENEYDAHLAYENKLKEISL